MRVFKDTQGRSWEISIDVSAFKLIKAHLDVDLNRIIEDNLMLRFASDPVLLGDTLYVLCKDQCEKLGISDVDFGRGLAGDALNDATKAFLDEVVNFTPSPEERENLKRVLEEARTMENLGHKLISDKLNMGLVEQIRDRELKKIETQIDSQLANVGKQSIDAPESAELNPDHSP